MFKSLIVSEKQIYDHYLHRINFKLLKLNKMFGGVLWSVLMILYFLGKFEEHEDIPCTHYDEKVEWLSCLSHGTGIVGSSFISVNGELGIIVPQKKEDYSEIFMIDYEVIQMPNQKENELEELVLLKNNLQVSIHTVSVLKNQLKVIKLHCGSLRIF